MEEKGKDGTWGQQRVSVPPHPGGWFLGLPGSETGKTPLRDSGQSCPSLRNRGHFKREEGFGLPEAQGGHWRPTSNPLTALRGLLVLGTPEMIITHGASSPCLPASSHLLPTQTLSADYTSHFTEEEPGGQRARHLSPSVSQCRAGIPDGLRSSPLHAFR